MNTQSEVGEKLTGKATTARQFAFQSGYYAGWMGTAKEYCLHASEYRQGYECGRSSFKSGSDCLVCIDPAINQLTPLS